MITDVNVNLSRWPFRRLPHDRLPLLVNKLRAAGITQAWAGSFDGLLHKDMRAVNNRLAEACRRTGGALLRPFGSINPLWPDWREDLRQCHEVHGMPGIRLHPNYHGYQLEDPAAGEVLALAERRGLIVQLAVRMEDLRMQHPLVRVPDVETAPLPRLLADRAELRLVVLNGLRSLSQERIQQLIGSGRVFFEISMLEGVRGVEKLLQSVPLDRLLFGSHFPFFILESALLKLRESDLTPEQVRAITHDNAAALTASG